MSNSFAWKVISNDLIGPKKTILKEKDVLQLKGIFLSLDDDRDGQLSSTQLADGLKLLGFSTREKFLLKFSVNAAQNKINGLNAMSFKTDFKTFCNVISKELKEMQSAANDLDYLFSFIDSNNTGFLSKKELKHLLTEVLSPIVLSSVEFNRFMKSLLIPNGSEHISIPDLKNQIIFGFLYV
jgi:Ca2+-binding EF-hand superfamily protein